MLHIAEAVVVSDHSLQVDRTLGVKEYGAILGRRVAGVVTHPIAPTYLARPPAFLALPVQPTPVQCYWIQNICRLQDSLNYERGHA